MWPVFLNLWKVLLDLNASVVTFAAASWYPLGRPSGQTLFPGLMTTSYLFHKILSFCGIIVSVYDVSCYLPPFFSCLTALVVHCFTKHASGSRAAGLFAALFVGISPAYIKTSLVGSYDNECIAIFAMISGFYMWTRAVKRGTMISALLAAIPSAYMASAWGGYVFLINAIAIHVFALCVLGLITPKHEVAYIVFYVIITAFCINIPFLNFTPLWSSEHMASHGVFVLVIASAVARFASSLVPKDLVKDLQAWVIGLAGLLILIVLSILALTVIQVEGVESPFAFAALMHTVLLQTLLVKESDQGFLPLRLIGQNSVVAEVPNFAGSYLRNQVYTYRGFRVRAPTTNLVHILP